MDVLLFASYREGLPNVPLEAAACELPTVGYRVTGVVDAVADGVTGTLAPPKDADSLGAALARYVSDASLRRAHGEAARRRVVERFTQRATWEAWVALYAS
jgi:glycosyltransferase involved in cell wall biosynthesis